MATLTRETSALVLGGLFVYELLSRNLLRAAACALAIIPFVVWREALTIIWGTVPSSAAMNIFDWPLAGVVKTFYVILRGQYGTRTGIQAVVGHAYAFASIAFLIAFSVLTATRVARGRRALVAAWLPVLALMSILGVNGPWLGPTGFFRAFTECWVVGCLLLDDEFSQSRLATPALAALVVIWLGADSLATVSID